MDTQIVFLLCLCDEVLKAIGYKDDPQCQMSTSETMNFATFRTYVLSSKGLPKTY